MTLKDELGFLYREMIQHKMWNDLLAEKETNTEKKKFYKGEAYMAVSTASKIDSIVRNHFKDGNKEVTEWLEQAKKDFTERTKDLRR